MFCLDIEEHILIYNLSKSNVITLQKILETPLKEKKEV